MILPFYPILLKLYPSKALNAPALGWFNPSANWFPPLECTLNYLSTETARLF
jgi:hypothetical protein